MGRRELKIEFTNWRLATGNRRLATGNLKLKKNEPTTPFHNSRQCR